MQLKGFIGPSYTLQSTDIECQRCVNLYPQMDESGAGKNVAALLGTPGLREFTVLDGAGHPVRGMITTSTGRLFAVTNTTLWEITADGCKHDRGTLNSSAGFVGIADNGRGLMLVDGPNGYGYDLTANTLSAPLPDFPGGATVAFQDGYFIFNQPNTQIFWITDPYSTTIDLTNFASAEGSPDNLLALLSDHELVWLFGTNSTEVWYDSGDPLFPFARVQGGSIQYGLAAARTPARFANSVVWLSRSEDGQGVVLMSNGLQPGRISTHAMEQEIATYPRIDDATAYTYQQDGHSFYVLNFPSGNSAGATWVYDAVTQLWHERAFTGAFGPERQRGEMHTEAFGKHIVSDYAKGTLYVMDRFALNDDGARITRIRTSPFVSDELKNIFVSRLQLDIQTGVGTADNSPQCMLQWSDDGGHTWSNEHWTGLGAIGATQTRVIWRRLGRTRRRVFKFTISDDCFVAINDALIELSAGTS